MRTSHKSACVTLTLMVLLLQGCESTDTADPEGHDVGQVDAFIEDIPLLADSFVLQTFELDADGEPVNVDSAVLVKEE